MKTILTIIATTVALAWSITASAADLGGPKIAAPPAKSAEIIVIKSPFAGAYIGAHAGYSQLADDADFSGWNGGGHVGFNAPMGGGLIAGMELDGTMSAANLAFTEEDASVKVNQDWTVSARAKLGMEIGNVMPYLTAGLAWTKMRATATTEEGTSKDSTTERLWIAGGGIDYSIPATNLIAGVAVLHMWDGAVNDGMTTVRGSLSVKLN